MGKYTPKIIEDTQHRVYIEMVVEGEHCKTCNKIMIQKMNRSRALFPKWMEMTAEKQMQRAGLVYKTYTKVDDEYICEECEKSGKADFLCALCEQRHPSEMIQEQFGDPAEFLCKQCYETKPAKIWEDKQSELYKSHQYDFE